mgnify:CR=1 FL=1
MKKTILSFFAILFLFVLFTGCENSKSKPNQDDEQNNDSLITTDDSPLTDHDSQLPDDDTGNTADLQAIFNLGPHFVNIIDIKEGDNGAPRDFRIFEPTGATGLVPVVHFLHGFQLKNTYYDDVLIHLSSHGFIVVSGQSEHSLMGGDTSVVEATKVTAFIEWIKTNLASKLTGMTPDFDNFAVSGHSRGGKVTNHVLNTAPAIAKCFFGLDPVDAPPPLGGDDPSLNNPVQFQGKSMFLGAEKGPEGMQACAPADHNSVNFYFGFPSPSRHIIAAGVGHMDMVDEPDLKACGTTCSLCAGSKDNALNTQFRTYSGGLMAAFFSSALKGKTEYETLLGDFMTHPFLTKVSESK